LLSCGRGARASFRQFRPADAWNRKIQFIICPKPFG